MQVKREVKWKPTPVLVAFLSESSLHVKSHRPGAAIPPLLLSMLRRPWHGHDGSYRTHHTNEVSWDGHPKLLTLSEFCLRLSLAARPCRQHHCTSLTVRHRHMYLPKGSSCPLSFSLSYLCTFTHSHYLLLSLSHSLSHTHTQNKPGSPPNTDLTCLVTVLALNLAFLTHTHTHTHTLTRVQTAVPSCVGPADKVGLCCSGGIKATAEGWSSPRV